MTAVAIWLSHANAEQPALEAAADTLVSSNGVGTLISDASKVLPLTVACLSPNPDGPAPLILSRQTYGYAFAGSTLLGQNTYLSLAALLENLIAVENYTPALEMVAAYVRDYLDSVFHDAKIRGRQSFFEVALFGYCSIAKRFAIYHYEPKHTAGTVKMTLTARENLAPGDYVYLGSYKSEFPDSLAVASFGPPKQSRPLGWAPRYVIEDFIADENRPLVGGDLQLWSAYSTGLFPRMMVRPKEPGRPRSQFIYLGRDLPSNLLHLGNATIGMLGVA